MSNYNKPINFFTMEQFSGKEGIGGTRIRAHNLIKHWDEACVYQYGYNPEVLIFQKVYLTFDYKFPRSFKGIKILDTCDPDFKDTPDIFIKETMDEMDAVVVPTESYREFLQQMTNTPVRVIKDRFDLSEFPTKKNHRGAAKSVVWFGYSHNAEALKLAVPSFEKRGLKLIIVSDQDPHAYRWAVQSKEYEDKYEFVKYTHPEAYKAIQKADVCVLPENSRPFDKFKSENKTVIAELCGVPVARNADDLDALLTAKARNSHIAKVYDTLKEEYDCRKSVQEYKDLLNEIK